MLCCYKRSDNKHSTGFCCYGSFDFPWYLPP